MAETWTEYAVRWDDEPDPEKRYEPRKSREDAERLSRLHPWPSIVVGRQVTASDWLPVDNGPASVNREDRP